MSPVSNSLVCRPKAHLVPPVFETLSLQVFKVTTLAAKFKNNNKMLLSNHRTDTRSQSVFC